MSLSVYEGSGLEIYDAGNGVVNLYWRAFADIAPSSYNVYLDGVLNQNVTTNKATISGLTTTSYNSATIAPTPNNSSRPQNMPPNGSVTNAPAHNFQVTAVKAGVEVATTRAKTYAPAPASIMLTTPMKRLWPFPNTGLD